jgi:hypothetical protein
MSSQKYINSIELLIFGPLARQKNIKSIENNGFVQVWRHAEEVTAKARPLVVRRHVDLAG